MQVQTKCTSYITQFFSVCMCIKQTYMFGVVYVWCLSQPVSTSTNRCNSIFVSANTHDHTFSAYTKHISYGIVVCRGRLPNMEIPKNGAFVCSCCSCQKVYPKQREKILWNTLPEVNFPNVLWDIPQKGNILKIGCSCVRVVHAKKSFPSSAKK